MENDIDDVIKLKIQLNQKSFFKNQNFFQQTVFSRFLTASFLKYF